MWADCLEPTPIFKSKRENVILTLKLPDVWDSTFVFDLHHKQKLANETRSGPPQKPLLDAKILLFNDTTWNSFYYYLCKKLRDLWDKKILKASPKT